MAKSTVRLLEVAVLQAGKERWKWNVCEGVDEIASGHATTREAAQSEGDSALFALLSVRRE